MEYKSINIELSKEIKKLNLVCLSDLHIGDPLCNLKKIKEVLNEIKRNPNTYIILNGDLINNATTSSVSDTYSERMKPLDELKMIVELLEPIKDRILLISNGN